ncbi:hypothetical protein LCGC14_0030820 [marine sediment metagenome]
MLGHGANQRRCIGFALLLLSPVVAAQAAQDWLARMAEAAREENFHGAFIYERTGSFTTHQIWHQVADEVVTERLIQTDGEPREWLWRDGELQCANLSTAKSGWRNTISPVAEPVALGDWYEFQVLGTTRVASRPVTVLAVQPRDAHRYGYEYYLDTETGLLLKSLMINDRQALLERFQFATFEHGPSLDDRLTPSPACIDIEPTSASDVVPAYSWQPAWLPAGFAIKGQATGLVDETGALVASQVYSDGIARFTLFIEPLVDVQLAENIRAQLGPTVAVSRVVDMSDGAYLATLVGEIPPETAESIVGSLLPDQREATP